MRKSICLLLSCLVLLGTFVACKTEEAGLPEQETPRPSQSESHEKTEEKLLPLPEEQLCFVFSSGAGGWGTELIVHADGSFEGLFRDSNMGEREEAYPNGTRYICSFRGSFGNVTKESDTAYRMELLEITLDYTVGEEWIEDGVLHIASEPYGLEDSTEFLLYLPETPVAELSETFLSWWPGRWDDPKHETLDSYAICNVATEQGFFG